MGSISYKDFQMIYNCRSNFPVLVGLLLVLCAFPSWAGIHGSVSGSVVDRDGVMASGAKVELIDESGKSVAQTQTSITGDYQFFPVQTGNYRISVVSEGQTSFKDIHVSTGVNTVADARLNMDGSAVQEMVLEVKAKRQMALPLASVSQTEIHQDQIRHLTQGSEVSLPKLLAATGPGVVAGPFGQLFFRGHHGNIQYQVDGVQLPESPSNSFGQALSPRNIDHMEVITGGIPAEYGQRLGAVVNIVTKTGPEKPGGELELNYGSYNTTSPHLLYGGSNESGSLHYFLSLNYNSTDRGVDTPHPQGTGLLDQLQGGKDSIHNAAMGNSEFAKVDWQADNSNKFSFIVSNSQNNLQIPTFPSSFSPKDPYFQVGYVDEYLNEGENGAPLFNYVPSNTNDTQSEINSYAQVVWKHTLSERSFLQLSPYYKYSSIVVTNDPTNDLFTKTPGANYIATSNATSFAQNRRVNNLGLKGDYATRPNENHLLKAGFQLQASEASGNFTIQRDLNAARYGQSDPYRGYTEGIYVQDDYTIFKPLVLNAGLRFDAAQYRFSDASTNDFLFQPRVGLSYRLTDTTQLHASYGKLFQPAPIENLRATYSRSNPNPIFYDIKPEVDDFYEVGIAQQLLGNQVASLNLYYRDATNLLDDAQLFNTLIAQPFNYVKGFAYGLELSVKGQLTKDWAEYFNYTYGVAKGKGISGGAWAAEIPHSDGYQWLDHAQEHTANGGLTYAKNHFWWSGQGVFGSGLRTNHDKENNLPSHFTADTTVGYEFHGSSWLSQFRLSADVLNVLDNRYAITIANGYNGSHYFGGRQFFLRLTKLL